MVTPLDRRTFLASVGVLGALAATDLMAPRVASATPTRPLVDLVSQLLGQVSKDTYKGLSAFVAPGSDAYSRSQGTERSKPGGLDAKTPDFLIESLNSYVPFPDQVGSPIARALIQGLDDVPIDLPGLPSLPLPVLDDLESVVKHLLRNDETLPLSVVIALLLNALAVQVDPTSAAGPFLSPFSRLSFAKKAAVFELMEGPDAKLVAQIDRQLPEPTKGTASGLLQFVSGAVLEFTAFGTFGEWATFDPKTGTVTEHPVGWKVSGYDPGSMEGWDEFKGYYQGRKKVSKA